MTLYDKVIIVPGSTTCIGQAIARRCVTSGARVLVHGGETALSGSVGQLNALVGRYSTKRAGIEAGRLPVEHNYLVLEDGLERLTHHQTSLLC